MWFILQLIVLGLVASDAAIPEDYDEICLIGAEGAKVGGIYAYDPEGEVIEGVPTMYMKSGTKVGRGDKSITYDSNDIVRKKKLSWDNLISGFMYGFAVRFSVHQMRLERGPHPCNKERNGQEFLKIVRDARGGYHEGWVTRVDGIVGTTCTPIRRAVEGNEPYRVPNYQFTTLISCVSWLKQLSINSGVKSTATAAEHDPLTGICLVYYETHNDMNVVNWRNNFCFLELTDPFPQFPGYFSTCKVDVQDQIFGGSWQLDFSTSDLDQPLLKKSMTSGNTMEFVNGFSAVFTDGAMLFSSETGSLSITMGFHICFGPDVSQRVEFDGSNFRRGVISRNDAGDDG